jgi:hypothetical protein
MTKRVLVIAALAVTLGVFVQTASADPTNPNNALFVIGVCGGTQVPVVVNGGNGTFVPAQALGSTAVFIPTAFDLTFSFTPTGGTTQTDHLLASKPHEPRPTITCQIPAALNTFTSPEGTFTLSGTVTGFFTPPH